MNMKVKVKIDDLCTAIEYDGHPIQRGFSGSDLCVVVNAGKKMCEDYKFESDTQKAAYLQMFLLYVSIKNTDALMQEKPTVIRAKGNVWTDIDENLFNKLLQGRKDDDTLPILETYKKNPQLRALLKSREKTH